MFAISHIGFISAPVNSILHSAFSKMVMRLNNTVINDCERHYGYRAVIESVLGLDNDVKATVLATEGFKPDQETEKGRKYSILHITSLLA